MKKYLFALGLLGTLSGFSQESSEVFFSSPVLESPVPLPGRVQPIDHKLESKKLSPYAVVSIVPGVGVSYRSRHDKTGRAWDGSFSVIPLSGYHTQWIPSVALDYNFLYFFRAKENSFYLSGGVGVGTLIPIALLYLPVRAGFEFKYGFIDVGARLVLGWIPIPEVRGGLTFRF